jgi:methylthioribose-1-phosphate isomerase
VLAARHRIPFYVCAPTSSIDLATADGDGIEIEERPPEEVLQVRDTWIAPRGTAVRNPAFDITPAELITGIVTEEGVISPRFADGLATAVAAADARRAARRPPPPATPAAIMESSDPVAPVPEAG